MVIHAMENFKKIKYNFRMTQILNINKIYRSLKINASGTKELFNLRI